jgi:hypothetical protein
MFVTQNAKYHTPSGLRSIHDWYAYQSYIQSNALDYWDVHTILRSRHDNKQYFKTPAYVSEYSNGYKSILSIWSVLFRSFETEFWKTNVLNGDISGSHGSEYGMLRLVVW